MHFITALQRWTAPFPTTGTAEVLEFSFAQSGKSKVSKMGWGSALRSSPYLGKSRKGSLQLAIRTPLSSGSQP